MVKTSPSNAGDAGSIPGWGVKIPRALGSKKKQTIKQKLYCKKFTKDFKNGPHQRKHKRKQKKTKKKAFPIKILRQKKNHGATVVGLIFVFLVEHKTIVGVTSYDT